MKATQLRKKFDAINKSIAAQIEKIYNLAEEYDDPEVENLLGEYATKLSDLVITDEDNETSASAILDFMDNELIPNEAAYNEDEENDEEL